MTLDELVSKAAALCSFLSDKKTTKVQGPMIEELFDVIHAFYNLRLSDLVQVQYKEKWRVLNCIYCEQQFFSKAYQSCYCSLRCRRNANAKKHRAKVLEQSQ